MDTIAPTWLWVSFVVSVLVALFADFVVLQKQGAHSVSAKEALNWSVVWVALSFAFNGLFWWAVHRDHGSAVTNEKSMEFLTGHLIEKSLAVDNTFVFLMLLIDVVKIPVLASLAVVVTILALTMIASAKTAPRIASQRIE
jgi:tellurite resistance protein TerC